MVLYRGIFFSIIIHELVALIHFIHGTRFHSFMSCYCIVDIWLCCSMIDIIPYGINPYIIPMIPLCGNP